MAITNGFDETVVLAAFLGRLAFKQPTETGYDILDSTNTTGTSGRYFNTGAFHAALTVQNIKDCQPNRNITSTQFNTLIQDMKKDMILSMLNTVFAEQQFIESDLLYHECGRSELVPIPNTGRFVGLNFEIANGNYAAMLNNVQLLFDGVATFNLYLYNDLKGKISTTSVTSVANQPVIVSLGTVLNYLSKTIKGGRYFLGYSQNDLGSVQALRYSASEHCFTILNATSFNSTLVGADDFNRREFSTSRDMYGLNPEISCYYDLTNKICQNVHLFDELQGLMMSKVVVDMVLNSTRTNEVKRISSDNLRMWGIDLKGYKDQVTGQFFPSFDYRIAKIAKEIRKRFLNISGNENIKMA